MTEVAGTSVFELPIRVYIEDTDAGGIVFHAKYLHYMERARTEWVRSQGVELRAGLEQNVSYVVQKMTLHYAAPAKLDDQLLVTAEPIASSRVSMTFRQQVLKADSRAVLCDAEVRVACVALDTGKPRRLPDNMSVILKNVL
ncbi:tol-pal system-associated acyl-CoA thioesterase [Marinobacter sp. S0848L]|uniref:tol-pal system-associated acyl-CoA thioesterase n=1 Tax=Marinobacter sp. S0848L TaxID=2926423 RepID=UPI001FF6EFEF|nr:tol-pal system-associated acyl-CoA thioesterase [Marinobacter sp. S0848L]MCK0105426.1 tol-pal system-associated acyl-CoA thioesterase [Marinobacter sp. S0848L]